MPVTLFLKSEGSAVSPDEAMQRLNTILAHAWMVRNFLKHADEAQEDEEMLEVHRVVFDVIRAVEPSFERRDAVEYLRRLRGKLPKLRKAAAFLQENYRRVSNHTNFEMAARSLDGCVGHIDEVLAELGDDTAARG